MVLVAFFSPRGTKRKSHSFTGVGPTPIRRLVRLLLGASERGAHLLDDFLGSHGPGLDRLIDRHGSTQGLGWGGGRGGPGDRGGGEIRQDVESKKNLVCFGNICLSVGFYVKTWSTAWCADPVVAFASRSEAHLKRWGLLQSFLICAVN